MKQKTTSLLFLGLIILFFSCKKDDSSDSNPNNQPDQLPNSSQSNYFVIDTSEIIQVSALGTNEKLLVDRKVNSNSYIKDLSIGANGSKFIYTDVQGSFGNQTGFVSTEQIRIFDLEKNTDIELLSTTTDQILAIKYCEDGQLFFARQNKSDNTVIYGTMNADGSGLKESNGYFNTIVDITSDRRFTLLSAYTLGSPPTVSITDATLDGGSGTYYSEPFTTTDNVYNGRFTPDGKKAVIPYRDGSDIKIRIVDMATKTTTTKTIVSGLTDWSFAKISMAHDDNNGLLIITGSDFKEKSKVYLFKLDDTTITSFDTMNEAIYQAYIY